MKRNFEILLAGLLGTVTVIGVIATRKYFKNKLYHSDYTDHHLLFDQSSNTYGSPEDGVELDAFL